MFSRAMRSSTGEQEAEKEAIRFLKRHWAPRQDFTTIHGRDYHRCVVHYKDLSSRKKGVGWVKNINTSNPHTFLDIMTAEGLYSVPLHYVSDKPLKSNQVSKGMVKMVQEYLLSNHTVDDEINWEDTATSVVRVLGGFLDFITIRTRGSSHVSDKVTMSQQGDRCLLTFSTLFSNKTAVTVLIPPRNSHLLHQLRILFDSRRVRHNLPDYQTDPHSRRILTPPSSTQTSPANTLTRVPPSGNLQTCFQPSNTMLDRTASIKPRDRLTLQASTARLSERAILQKNLSMLGFLEYPVKGDGNCQFRTLSWHLSNGDEEDHSLYRRYVIQQLDRYRRLYKHFVSYDSSDDDDDDNEYNYNGGYQAYLNRMAVEGEWGDHLTLQAAADCFRMRINVITSHLYDASATNKRGGWLHRLRPRDAHGADVPPEGEIWMAFCEEEQAEHYTPIVKEGATPMETAPSTPSNSATLVTPRSHTLDHAGV